ncbi:hypothetical protein FRUB_07537 [Fimbriiglobus ruber]|uniref:Uncharacterized protein n=1 Tax=Fimbriiglobus ruber TaxID=1908690 RepID=A0A225DQG2_9BACT|nr:hypothetical protein FRUB_07537 [Fimbriiglobus ruber]
MGGVPDIDPGGPPAGDRVCGQAAGCLGRCGGRGGRNFRLARGPVRVHNGAGDEVRAAGESARGSAVPTGSTRGMSARVVAMT